MKHFMSAGILFFVVMALSISQPGVAQEVSLESLLKETVSLERLTVIPSPSYVTRQFSSYDRKSTDPVEPTEENWFANADRGQHLRVEENQGRQEFVLMDAEGPGAVVRFWSANPKDGGVVRIYLDNKEYPAIEMPLYVLMGGQTAPFIAPFSGEHSKGWNCYMPIPYSEHCKITISEGNIYYQINYRTYAPGTAVKTFTLGQADSAMALIRENAGLLAKPVDAVKDGGGEVNSYDVRLNAGSSDSLSLTVRLPYTVLPAMFLRRMSQPPCALAWSPFHLMIRKDAYRLLLATFLAQRPVLTLTRRCLWALLMAAPFIATGSCRLRKRLQSHWKIGVKQKFRLWAKSVLSRGNGKRTACISMRSGVVRRTSQHVPCRTGTT